jgi:dTDP-4-dehydrorhamnose reductase
MAVEGNLQTLRIAVFGTSGQLGSVLQQTLSERHEVVSYARHFDVRHRETVFSAVRAAHADVVVNAASMTNIDRCERDAEAFSVNALGPRWLAQACEAAGVLLVQMSTDHVFSGEKGAPYHEWDVPGPVQDYGRSKLAGELEVRAHAPRHLIIRTGWLYGGDASDFPQVVLERARRALPLRVLDDYAGSPTCVDDLARALLELLEAGAMGTVHVANPGTASRFTFAREIVHSAGLTVPVRVLSSEALAGSAPRPKNSSLTSLVLPSFGVVMQPWPEALRKHLRKLLAE